MKKLFILLIICLFAAKLYSQTRGTEYGEFYISGQWYLNSDNEFVFAVWRTIDNGEHLALQYTSTTMPEQSTAFYLVSDATPGVLYATNCNKLYISYDYGNTWSFVENYYNLGNYSSGCTEGEIYKTWTNEPLLRVELQRSISFGQNFTIVNDSIGFTCEVGTEPNEVYLNYLQFFDEPYKLYYSNNNGINFNLQCELDTSIAGYSLGGLNTQITRGAVAGELYLTSWHTPGYYQIYYSSDYGQTFELKYQSGYINYFYGGAGFTAGREPGSFFIIRGIADPTMTHMHLAIKYSSDYAETFTTYYHDLDSNYNYTNIYDLESYNNICYNYPNPFTKTTSFNYNQGGYLNIYDLNGNFIYQTELKGNSISIDFSFLKPGIYIYKLVSKDNFPVTGKMIKTN